MNLLLTFTSNLSLKDWDNSGIIERETLIYKKLVKKGINTTFLTYGDKSDLQYSVKLEKIEVLPINLKKKSKKFSFFNIVFHSLFKYKKFKTFDVIKTNQMLGSWIAWILKIIFRKKLIVRCGFEELKISLHQYNYISRNKRLLFRIIFLYCLEWISYRLADHIIMTNNVEREFVIRNFNINPNKISVISNYVDVNLFKPISMKKKEKKIIFVGSLNEYKNLDNLIESFKDFEDYSLDIVGKGKLKMKLTQKIKDLKLQDKIKFLGIFPNSELPRILNQYNIFIIPSFTEGNPKALLEAMGCGIACIGSNIPGINQIIKHKMNGYLCNLDSLSIANAIEKIKGDPIFREKLGNKAREYVVKNCSLEGILEKELKIYKSKLN